MRGLCVCVCVCVCCVRDVGERANHSECGLVASKIVCI